MAEYLRGFVDPGVWGCGVSLWAGPQLVRACYVKNPLKTLNPNYRTALAMGRAVHGDLGIRGTEQLDELYIEMPRVYPGSKKGNNPNDLLHVMAVGASVAASVPCRLLYPVTPQEWKGTVAKRVMTERIFNALTQDERGRCGFTNKSDDSDMLDAVGMGLWLFQRLSKKRYPGATL